MASKRIPSQSSEEKDQEARQPFNLATMSGIFPGTRTQIFQRIQVQLPADRPATTGTQRRWMQLLWPEPFSACVGYLLGSKGEPLTADPLIALSPTPDLAMFNKQLGMALWEAGYQLRACGSCRFWQPLGTVNPDQLPVGRCSWRSGSAEDLPVLLADQSHLALPCLHWQWLVSNEPDPVAAQAENQEAARPMRRAAEEAEIRFTFAQRIWRRLVRRQQARQADSDRAANRKRPIDWTRALVERSGVGAGTEPCFACQGRIANLGALTVATAEDDKQTFSIWRCRNCYSLYLNNWVDRWERLDSLETEESYYRIAPAEAFTLLALIHGQTGGEHPKRRHERGAERQIFLDFIADRVPLSHQIRQGR